MLKTIVGDDGARLEEAVRDAMRRSDIVITTGGLGPTEDDITRQFTASAIGRELVYHDEIEAHLRERFRNWGREMPDINKRQAYVIEGGEILPNPNGSAVGMMVEMDNKISLSCPDRRVKISRCSRTRFPEIKGDRGDVFVGAGSCVSPAWANRR